MGAFPCNARSGRLKLPPIWSDAARGGEATKDASFDHSEGPARLLGAIEAAHEAVGVKRGDNGLHAERITAETRAALEPAAFERIWSAGRALPLEEAVVEAVTIADEVATSADC